MADANYDAMGRFIYGAYRNGGNGTDVANWMADDLGLPRPASGSDDAKGKLYDAFFTMHTDIDELEVNYARFIQSLNSRAS